MHGRYCAIEIRRLRFLFRVQSYGFFHEQGFTFRAKGVHFSVKNHKFHQYHEFIKKQQEEH